MLKDIAFVNRGFARSQVFKLLEKPMTPTQLAKSLGKHRASVSEILAVLTKSGYAKPITAQGKKYTLYALTKKGKTVLQEIKKMGLE